MPCEVQETIYGKLLTIYHTLLTLLTFASYIYIYIYHQQNLSLTFAKELDHRNTERKAAGKPTPQSLFREDMYRQPTLTEKLVYPEPYRLDDSDSEVDEEEGGGTGTAAGGGSGDAYTKLQGISGRGMSGGASGGKGSGRGDSKIGKYVDPLLYQDESELRSIKRRSLGRRKRKRKGSLSLNIHEHVDEDELDNSITEPYFTNIVIPLANAAVTQGEGPQTTGGNSHSPLRFAREGDGRVSIHSTPIRLTQRLNNTTHNTNDIIINDSTNRVLAYDPSDDYNTNVYNEHHHQQQLPHSTSNHTINFNAQPNPPVYNTQPVTTAGQRSGLSRQKSDDYEIVDI